MENAAKNHLAEDADAAGLTRANREAVETLYRAFNTNQPHLIDEALAPDWDDIPLAPGQAAGRDGLKPLLSALVGAFTDARFTVQDIVGHGDTVAVRMTFSGRHTGEWMGVAPSGRTFEINWHEFHHLSDGRIVRTWHLEDWAGWRAQVGILSGEHA